MPQPRVPRSAWFGLVRAIIASARLVRRVERKSRRQETRDLEQPPPEGNRAERTIADTKTHHRVAVQPSNNPPMKFAKFILIAGLVSGAASLSLAGPGPQYWVEQARRA